MVRTKMKNLSTILTILFFIVVTCSLENSANAGILFGNRRQVIRTTQPQFRQQNYNVRTSTAVLRSTNPRLGSTGFGGVSDQMRLIKARYKYDVALAKWDQKKRDLIAKRLKKERELAIKESKRRELEVQRLKKQQEKDQSKINFGFGSSQLTAASSSSSRGALGMGNSPVGKKKGFWASLMQAIFGRKDA